MVFARAPFMWSLGDLRHRLRQHRNAVRSAIVWQASESVQCALSGMCYMGVLPDQAGFMSTRVDCIICF